MVRLLCSQTQGRWHQTNVLVTQQDLELFKLCHWFTQLNTNRNSGFWAIIWYFGNTTVVQFNLINVTSTTNNASAQKEADLHDIHSLPMTRSWGKSKLDLSRTSQYIYFYVWWSCLVVSLSRCLVYCVSCWHFFPGLGGQSVVFPDLLKFPTSTSYDTLWWWTDQ